MAVRLCGARLPLLVVSVVAALALAAPAWAAEVPAGHIQQAGFPPCDWASGPPPISSCTDTAPKVTADCDPAGTSTVSVTRQGFGWNFLFGTFSETVTATIGPQTGPPQPEIQVLSSGIRNGTVGFPTGRILSLSSTFEFESYDGRTRISGTKSLVDDLANVGVCREYDGTAPSDSTLFGSVQLTGYFYIVNAQVLSYSGTMTVDGVAEPVSGPAETYLSNSFATCCGGDVVNASTGHLATSFGTTHPALGSTWWTSTPTGSDVEVVPAPGVVITFAGVTAAGDTTVVVKAPEEVPPLPADGSFLVGDPPALYEISTAATFTPPVTICVPYGGSAPPGTIPTLLHYEGGSWQDVATSYDEVARIVCGEVDSFSPFAAGFRPAAPASAADCRGDGWTRFAAPPFKNQGDCVSFVATKGKNSPNG